MFEYVKQKQKEFPKLFEILRFLVSGTIATLIDMLVMAFVLYLPNKELFFNNFMNVFYYGGICSTLNIVIATGIGFIVGLAFNYLFSIWFVFDGNKSKAKSKKGIIQFCILSVIGLLIQTLGMFIGNGLLHFNEWVMKVILIIVVLAFNYITRKIFIFNEDKNKLGITTKKEEAIVENKTKQSKLLTLIQIFINTFFIFSCLCLCYSLFNDYTGKIPFNNINFLLKILYSTIIVGFLSLLFFIIDKNLLLNFIKKPRKAYIYILSSIATFSIMFAIKTFSPYSGMRYIIANFMCFFSIFVFVVFVVELICNALISFYKSLTKTEKISLLTIIIVGFIACFVLHNLTSIFTMPNKKSDALLSFDTGFYANEKYAMNIFNHENDARHIIMSFCMLPFYVLPYFVSIFLNIDFIYPLLSQLTQIVLIAISIVLVLRLFKIKNKLTHILLTVLFCLTSTIIINAITVEKFVISFFYIVLTLYFSLKNSNYKWLAFALSVGILTTNALLLPIVFICGKENISKKLNDFFIALVLFVFTILILGQFNLVIFFFDSLQHILYQFSSTDHPLMFMDKFKQVITFNANIFLNPKIIVNDLSNICQISPDFNLLFYVGCFVSVLWVLGFIFNYKDKFSIICFYWNLTMIFMLLFVGYGSLRNEMFIYSLIYIWSTLYLIYKFFDRIIKNKKAFNILLIIAIVCLATYNSYTFVNLLKVASNYYPAKVF